MIGDGMSLMHIQAAWTVNHGHLWLENAQATGLSLTPVLVALHWQQATKLLIMP